MEITIPYWKKVWKTLASGLCRVPKDVITGLLNEVGDDLCKGIKVYDTPFNKIECQCWLKESELKEFDPTFEKFFIRLCKSLNLQAESCWSVLCNYLLYEFHGKLSRIKLLSMYEPFATKLIESIWHFYTSERMYVLKTLRFILESYTDVNYADVFSKYMKRVTWQFFWGNVVGQIETLIVEITQTTAENTIDTGIWKERNYQEQLEVALIAIAGIEFHNFKVEDFVPLLRVYMKSNFGKTNTARSLEEFDQLCCAEIGAFLVFLDNCWSNPGYWAENRNDLDELVSLTVNCRGHNLIMFSWATLQADLCLNDGNEYIARYSKRFDTLLASTILEEFRRFASNVRKFNCKPGRSVLKGVYSLIEQLCNIFNENGFISLQPGTCEIMYELLKDDEICSTFLFDNTQQIHQLLAHCWRFFPYDFKSATLLMLALTEKGYDKVVVSKLKNLEIYAEEYSDSLRDESKIVVRTDYFPIENSKHIRIPSGTTAIVYAKYKKTLLLYQTKYKYFNVLLSQLEIFLAQIAETQTFTAETYERLFWGLKLIAKLLRSRTLDVNSLGALLLRSIKRVYHVFGGRKFRNFAVVDVFLQAVENAMFAKIDDQLRFWPSDFLPLFDRKLWESNVFLRSKLLELLEGEEQNEAHLLLFTYIKFIRRAFDTAVFRKEVQLPGIIFLVKTVFPKLSHYKYSDPMDYYRLTNMILEIVYDVIKQDRSKINNEEDKFLYDFCLDAFLKDSYVLKGYCELFKVTLFMAQKSFEREINWEKKKTLPINKYITLTLETFLLLIKHNRYRKTHDIYNTSVFEQVVLFAPLERLNTVKILTAYVSYAFDNEVQKLALQVLQNLALDKSYPMFGPMDVEPSQLQSFFLDKLRDPTETDKIKMEIIEFVLICVEHQPGLTDAFFNVSILKSDEEEGAGESVVGCMMDFLGNIEESKITIQHPLLRGVLSVIHKVWDIGGTHLIEKVSELKNFWPTLVKPLSHELVGEPKFYGYIFGILAHEFLYSKRNLSEAFKKVVRELLDVNKGFMNKWALYLVNITKRLKDSKKVDQFDDVSYSGDIFVVYAWKLFVSYGHMFGREFFQEPKLRAIITETCLDALLAHFKVMGEVLCIKFWSELYALSISEWPTESFTTIVPQLFSKTQQVLKALLVDYNGIEAPTKQAILSATTNLLRKFKSFADANCEAVEKLLEPLASVLRFEFEQLVEDVQRGSDEMPDSITNWLLIQSMINKILLLKNVEKHRGWFEASGYIKKVMWCVGPFVKSPATLPFAKYSLKSLLIYVQSPFAMDLLPISKGRFFQDTVPPLQYVFPPLQNTQLMREWWLTYAKLMELMNALITKFCYALSEDVLVFLDFHDDTIIASLDLIKVTPDPAALNLICCVLLFCNNMLLWRGRWIIYKENYFARTLNSIKSCISGVCNLILRPKSLGFVLAHNHTRFIANDQIPEETILDIYNIALEALTLGIRFFTRGHPLLSSYIDNPQQDLVLLQLEKDFYIPKYNFSELNIFTYGGILCILHFLCKAYTKINEHLRKTAAEDEKMFTRRTLLKMATSEELLEVTENQNKSLETVLPIILAQADVDLVHDPIAAMHKFTSTNFSLFEMPWFLKLNFKTVQLTLEMLSYFVVLELSSDLRCTDMSQQMREYMKREVGSEMQFFNDFVKRSVQERLESIKIDLTSPREQMRLERFSRYMCKVLKDKDGELHDEFFWVLNHFVQINCQTEDDDN